MSNIDNRIAILPLGAYEYHGAHLPYDTDILIAEGFCHRLKRKLSTASSITFLPVEKIGYSIEHQGNNDTKTLSYQEAIEKWIKIGEDCYKKGIFKLLLFNAHGGNSPLLTIVATELRVRFNMLAVATSWRKFGLPQHFPSPEELQYDIHGGYLETSLILALKPETVVMQAAENFSNHQKDFINSYHYLRAYHGSNFGWMMKDLNLKHACGNASTASAFMGENLLEYVTEKLMLLIDDIKAFDLEHFQHNKII